MRSLSSNSTAHTPTEADSDLEFSVYSLSSELDLDFAFRGVAKSSVPEDRELKHSEVRKPESLLVLTAKEIASHFPFEAVESSNLTIPEELQRLIAFHSFPTDEDDIWLYSCLSSGGSYEFDQGEALWADKAVRECVQIGFHLSATVLTSLHIAPASSSHPNTDQADPFADTTPVTNAVGPYRMNFSATDTYRPINGRSPSADGVVNSNDSAANRTGFNIEPGYPAHRVSLTFDRGRITSCSCTCTFDLEERCVNLTSPRTTAEDGTNQHNFPEVVQFSGSSVATSTTGSGAFPYQPMLSTEHAADNSWSVNASSNIRPSFLHMAPSRSNNTRSGQIRSRGSATVRSFGTQRISPGVSEIRWNSLQQAQSEQSNSRPYHDLAGLAGGAPPPGTWCSHVVATCLMRIRQPDKVLLRAPISESLSKLSKEDLQKFAQNLICHVGPRKILPAAQRILDQLLASTDNPIKSSCGAPDPTAGGAMGDAAAWCFDGAVLEEKLRVTLHRFWASKPSVLYSDIGSLNSSFPADVENFHCVLHSLRGNDPRGVWDLLSIIGDMMRRQDNNGVLLLEIVTRCILDMKELMVWWYLVQFDPCVLPKGIPICQKQTQYSAFWLCEEIVQLWRLVCLNPQLRPQSSHVVCRFPSGSSVLSSCSNHTTSAFPSSGCWLLQQLNRRLCAFHVFALEQAGFSVAKNMSDGSVCPSSIQKGDVPLSDGDHHLFVGFKPALAACTLTWPSELPPTHTLSSAEFRACMPTFVGARVLPSGSSEVPSDIPGVSSYINYMRTTKPLNGIQFELEEVNIDVQNSTAYLFNNLPKPQDEVDLAFSRFQALDAHGYSNQALLWARYLACRLLYLSTDFVRDCEYVAFSISSSSSAQSGPKSNTKATAESSSNLQKAPLEPTSEVTETTTQGPTRHGRKTTSETGTLNANPVNVTSSASDQPGLARVRKAVSSRISNAQSGVDSNVDKTTKLDPSDKKMALDWAVKVSTLLDRIRCLMECLTRSYNHSIPNRANVSSASRITNSGRTLLTFRGPDPSSLDIHLDDTASPVAQQNAVNNLPAIKDEWTCIDIELAFRLGFYGLTLPRPPTLSPTVEVRLFDQEIALLSHILVPYNLAVYVFHLLVGIHPTSDLLANLTNPNYPHHRQPVQGDTNTPATSSSPVIPPIVESDSDSITTCPVLATGAVLAGTGLPLVVSNYHRQEKPQHQPSKSSASYLQTIDISDLRDSVISDADLGFAAVLSVLGARSRVPEQTYQYFVEGQWAQQNALVVYLFRHYRDDLAKLDRMLLQLFDRHYNPYFKAPPLWACLTLSPRELMRYGLPETPPKLAAPPVNGSSSLPTRSNEILTSAQPSNPLPASVDPVTMPQPKDSSSITGQEPTMYDVEQSLDCLSITDTSQQLSTDIVENPNGGSADFGEDACSTQAPTSAPAVIAAHDDDSEDNSNKADKIGCPPSCSSANRRTRRNNSAFRVYDATSASEDTDTVSDSKLWAETFRCATLRDPRKRERHSVGMAAVDTSAPETTSSDNSPATTRRLFILCRKNVPTLATGSVDEDGDLNDLDRPRPSSAATQPGNPDLPLPVATPTSNSVRVDSSTTSGRASCSRVIINSTVAPAPNSSYSSFSSLSEDDDHVPVRTNFPERQNPLDYDNSSPVGPMEGATLLNPVSTTSDGLSTAKVTSIHTGTHADDSDSPDPYGRGCKDLFSVGQPDSEEEHMKWPLQFKRPPPQPLSDSIAFHTFHLAKLIRKLAGGPSASGSVFVAVPEANGTVHRNLQLAAFQIGLYGLGLYNGLIPSWQSRTYSRNGGWISQQVFEIGIPAACILYHSWQQHLTAAEVAGIAFQLSRENNRVLVDIAAELCLASLSMCTTLKPHEIYRAISQCEEHSSLTLERGLLRIENSDIQSNYGILPEIYFFLARSWFTLYQSAVEDYKKAAKAMQEQQQQQQTLMASSSDIQSELRSSPSKSSPNEAAQTPSSSPSVFSVTNAMRSFNSSAASYDENLARRNEGDVIPGWSNYQSAIQPPAFPPLGMLHAPPLTPSSEQTTQPFVYQSPSLPREPNYTVLPPPTSVYPSMFYFAQSTATFQQPQLYCQYSPQQQQQQASALLTQSAPPVSFSFAPPPQLNQSYIDSQNQLQQCIQNSSFQANPSVSVSVSPGLSSATQPQPIYIPSSNMLSTNPQLNSTMSQIPGGPFGPRIQSPDSSQLAQQTAQAVIPTFNMLYQFSGRTEQSVLANAQSTARNASSVPMCSSAILTPTPSTLLSPSRLLSAVGPPQLALAQRFASMSNASSSVVVHPASSDRASSTSETDSSRPADSVVEGLIDETANGGPNQPAASSRSSVTDSCGDPCNALKTTQTSTPAQPTLQSMEAKAHLYLRKAYLCATSAIKKIFMSQTVSSGSMGNQSGVSITSVPMGRAGRGRHHHHHHFSTPTQPRRPSCFGDQVNSNAASAPLDITDQSSSVFTSGFVANGSNNYFPADVGRPKCNFPVGVDTPLAKGWDANILWTLDVASRLGPSTVHEYCSLILQCVQCPLLMKQITTKVIEYFKSLSPVQPVPNPAPLNQLGSQSANPTEQLRLPSCNESQTNPNNISTNPVNGAFFACMPPKPIEQPPQFYPPNFAYTVLSNWPVLPNAMSASGAWPVQQPPSNPGGALMTFPSSAYQNLYSLSSSWNQYYSTVSTIPTPQNQDQLNEAISRYQQLSLRHDQAQSGPFIPDSGKPNLITNPELSTLSYRPSLAVVNPWRTTAPTPSRTIYQPAVNNELSCCTPSSSATISANKQCPQQYEFDPRELIERFVNRTHALFHKFIEQRLQYIGQSQAEWDEFVDLILKAYNVHLGMPATDCGLHWNNLLTRIRRHHKCSAALWQRILAGIQTADLKRSA
ncbi:unnamed protein product [Calicophoron daubneyi]|uniref:ZSWIM8 TPR repeats domain-containing protein n=1 Tax=Calicophoron daubneyi TaxID=300641 RepID=A0AAV2TW73_CALDB